MDKELKFKCPKCGNSELVSIKTSKELYYVKSITDDPIDPIIYHEKTETRDHWKNCFKCSICKYSFELSEEEMVKWIKENCPQE